jgi:hypothetical protein
MLKSTEVFTKDFGQLFTKKHTPPSYKIKINKQANNFTLSILVAKKPKYATQSHNIFSITCF